MELVGVAAVAENGVIGRDGELPWPSIPADKRQYRELVAGAPIVLGRRTFESMRDDLPGEFHVVLSRNRNRSYDPAHTVVVSSVPEALEILRNREETEAYVLGGGGIYEAFFPEMDRLRISRVSGSYPGDVRFPEIDPEIWECTERTQMEGFTLEVWERRSR